MALGEPFVDRRERSQRRRRGTPARDGPRRPLGFDEADVGRVAIVVTEAATNLVKHAGGGEILGRALGTATRPALEILALDRGPGHRQSGRRVPGRLLVGRQLPARAGRHPARLVRVRRLLDAGPAGPAVLSVLQARSRRGRCRARRFASQACRSRSPGEEVCGDAWTWRATRDGVAILVVDGLGHGPGAAEAAQEARRLFQEDRARNPAEMLDRCIAGFARLAARRRR